MRAGGYTVHQSLTAEAAAVLKLALGLARRRGHSQVTPLHVAFTLLSASASSPLCAFAGAGAAASSCSCAYGLLRRACARAHPAAAAAAGCAPPPSAAPHPQQCRALELCFNVALNRLPTTNAVGSPPSSSAATSFVAALVQHNPTLSNALVAALKRAQANQRRGCAELQSQSPPPSQPQQQQQQQPLLTIKAELDQLIVSILDDPSVSRVMREAGFSSAAIKANIEEESAALLGAGHHHSCSTSPPSSAPAPAIRSQLFLDPYARLSAHAGGGAAWPAQFLCYQPEVEAESPCKEEDVQAIMEVMLRKHGGRSNPVVVGDSVSVAEASVAELMRRLERGDVPGELRGAHALRLHLSHVHVRLMTRADVDAWVADLRRGVAAATNASCGGLVVYVGDMRWAVGDDDEHNAAAAAAAAGLSFSPAAHMAAELARLVGELRAASRGRAWLVAAASYQTYMRCRQGAPAASLEAAWALKPVAVPAGALGLGLARGSSRATDFRAVEGQLDLAPKDLGLCLSFDTPAFHGTTSKINHKDVKKTSLSLLFPETPGEADRRWGADDMDGKPVAAQAPDAMVHSGDMRSVPCPWQFHDLKRKAERGQWHGESKRWNGGAGLDLNKCADDGEDVHGGSSEDDEPVPSDLTSNGDGSGGGDVSGSLENEISL
ncbi:hypothetical protein ACP4OV_009709 [Aristida adscensionis]